MKKEHLCCADACTADAVGKISLTSTVRVVVRKILAIALLTTLTLLIAGLYGCSNKTEAAQQSLESTLGAVQAGEVEAISPYLSAVTFDPNLYSINKESFIAVYFADFSYQITEVAENSDNTVAVTVELTSRHSSEVLALMREALDSRYSSESTPQTSADAAFIDLADAHTWRTYTYPYTITMTQVDDGTWQVADAALFGAILLDGYDPRQLGE